MTDHAKSPSLTSSRVIATIVLLAGAVTSILAYREGRAGERAHAVAEVEHRAALRHALTREILGHYEDALFGLAGLFTLETRVSREEFVRAASRLEDRIAGVQAFEWVPQVKHSGRAVIEESQRRIAGQETFEFFDAAADGRPVRAPDRADYLPILFVHPLTGNAQVVGYDLAKGPTREVLARARAQRSMQLTPQIRLLQESGQQSGVVMVLPVFRGRDGGPAPAFSQPEDDDGFRGFVQCVFRVNDLLQTVQSRPPATMLEVMFIDAAETDLQRRVLFFGVSNLSRGPAVPTEEAFRQGLYREHPLSFGNREWRVLFRPPDGWLESQYTSMPVLRSGSILLMCGLVAGLVVLNGRRTQLVRREVETRTAELTESRRQLASLVHSLPGMMYRCTYDGQLTVLFLSQGAYELTGWKPEEFMSGAVHFRDCIHPDDLERVREATRRALESQSDVEVEYRVRTKSGAEKWVLSRGRGVYGPDGALNVFEGLAIDITAQKQAEAARLELERKLLEGQKLESLGLLAGGIAHDFNNLLSSILGNASMARLSLNADSGIDGQLRAIESASLRAAELCRQMLAYAGKGRFVVEPTDLSLLVEDLLPLLKISIAHQASLTLKLARTVPPVQADATQLRQIVMNLVLNAADAVADRAGEIVLSTGRQQVDRATLAGCAAGTDLPEGEYVFLEVRDNGAGMTPEVQAKIFDPFFTTKFAGRGLGLAAVLGIVRGHRGALRVDSVPGQGTSFRLFLPPQSTVGSAARSVDADPPTAPKRTGHVLVVDDEEQVRSVLEAMLKVCGFSATGVSDGESAVARFRAEPNRFDIVVLDLLMPGLTGEQTFQALRAIKPDVRVLIVSGYSEGDILGRLGGEGRVAFLAKPFTRATLERRLQELLA